MVRKVKSKVGADVMHRRASLAGLVLLGGLAGGARAELPPLIPREVLFGNPDKANPQISPDGKRLAYLAPDEGVLNVWVRTIGKSDDRPVTKDRKRGVRAYFWAQNNEQILYIQDKDGDENWHLYGTKLRGGETKDYTPYPKVQARVESVDPKFPDEILVSVNVRDPQLHDVYRLNLRRGALKLIMQNDEKFVGWTPDHDYEIRGGVKVGEDGSVSVHVRDKGDMKWRQQVVLSPEDALTSGPIGFSADGTSLFMINSSGSNTGQLRELSLSDGREKVVASDDTFDVSEVLMHPTKYHIEAIGFMGERLTWKVIDPAIEADFAAIAKIRDGDFRVRSRDRADRVWLVTFDLDNGPVYYYAFDRKTKKAELLFSNRKALEGLTLARMQPVKFKARDGLDLHAYLTVPPGVEPKNLPMVLNVHGGPWARDTWGYDGEVQWLANRGYAVLQVNFRGSTGYGKKFLNAGDREWGGKMQDDLVDAVQWAIKQGVADPKRVTIFGGSYGGYATLAGLAFTPDLFTCGVDIVGPSNLITFQRTIPDYWKPIEPIFWARVGHPEKDAEFLKARSPLFKVDQITKPLLIAQGANDPRVNKAESLQMVEALKKAGKIVEYVEYADEGHGFARPENRLDFYGKAERFLAEHLGGRQQDANSLQTKPSSDRS